MATILKNTTIMKIIASLFVLSAVALLWSCDKQEPVLPVSPPEPGGTESVPEGYFVVTFGSGDGTTKAAVSGSDGRVRHLRYVLYTGDGQYVKDRIVMQYADGVPSWPLPVLRDTLPKGEYKAVFLANVEKSFFPYGSPAVTQEVLLNYKTSYSAARIALPPAQFTDNTEYYMARADFSTSSAQPTVLLQRIIGLTKVHRNFIDAQTALNKLTANIVAQVDYKNFIRTTVNAALPSALRTALDKGTVGNAIYTVVGGLDGLVNSLVGQLVEPLTDTLYNRLLRRLVNDVGTVLTGNADQTGMLAAVGVLLNPWALNEAQTAIVTIDNFPKTMDYGLTVYDKFPVGTRFRFDFGSASVYAQKDLLIRGLNGLFDIRQINVIKQGLVSGLVVDQTIDGGLVLNASFIDIKDPLQATIPANRRKKSDYSFADLTLASYTPQEDNQHKTTVSASVGQVGNLKTLLRGIPLIGSLLDGIILDIGNVTVVAPVYLPALNVENLRLSGGWSAVTSY